MANNASKCTAITDFNGASIECVTETSKYKSTSNIILANGLTKNIMYEF